MQEFIFPAILMIAAFVGALVVAVGLVGSVDLLSRAREGLLYCYFYALFLKVAIEIAFSGRTLLETTVVAVAESTNPVLGWFNRIVSLLMIIIAIERIAQHYRQPKSSGNSASTWLLLAFIVFWVSNDFSPAFFGTHRDLSHQYLYPLIIGVAALFASYKESCRALDAFCLATSLFIIAGLLLIPIRIGLVMDTSYNQGFIPGLPRLAGLAPHANSLGIATQMLLLCLWVRPMRTAWMNRCAWCLGLLTLFLTQSKTAWLSFAICALCLLMVRGGQQFWRDFGNPRNREASIAITLAAIICLVGISVVLLFGDMGARMERFFSSAEGVQLTSLTGRDRIWTVAFAEWDRSPIFGYGLTLFNPEFQRTVGVFFGHAHNQFVDTLARSGVIGATGLVIYTVVLLLLSIRYCRTSGGLTLALFLALAFRSISEVPLAMTGISFEFIGHALLLIVLAGQIRQEPERVAVRVDSQCVGLLAA